MKAYEEEIDQVRGCDLNDQSEGGYLDLKMKCGRSVEVNERKTSVKR